MLRTILEKLASLGPMHQTETRIAPVVALCLMIALLLTLTACPGNTNSSPAASDTPIHVPVTLKGASGLGALQLEISYETSGYDLIGATAGQLGVNAIVRAGSETAGRTRLAIVSTEGISGDGVVCNLTFLARGNSKASDVNVVSLEAEDTELRELKVSASQGRMAAGGQVTGIVITFQK